MFIFYGANCTFWTDDEKELSSIPESGPKEGLPCCPHCKGVLFQIEKREWEESAEQYEDAWSSDPNNPLGWNWTYHKFLRKVRESGTCFSDWGKAKIHFSMLMNPRRG